MMNTNELSGLIVDAAVKIHRELGPGLFESVYQEILIYELEQRSLTVDAEVPVPVRWKEIEIQIGFRADMIVNKRTIVELKSVENTAPVHRKQLLTYLKLTGLKVGLLLNFGESLMKNGIHRLVNEFDE